MFLGIIKFFLISGYQQMFNLRKSIFAVLFSTSFLGAFPLLDAISGTIDLVKGSDFSSCLVTFFPGGEDSFPHLFHQFLKMKNRPLFQLQPWF